MGGGHRRDRSRDRRRDDSEEEERRRRDKRDRSRDRYDRRDDSSEGSRSRRDKRDRRRDEDSSEERSRRDKRDDRSHSKASKSKKSKKKKAKSSGKKKKRRNRSSSTSSSSSSASSSSISSDSSTELLLRLEEERRALKAKRREEKERMKDEETAEEKRQRRLMKKELKKMREFRRGGGNAVAGIGGLTADGEEEETQYTNDDNPFGDSNLTQGFRWGKKLEKEGLANASERDLARIARQNAEAQRQELEKVKLSRIQREREREERQFLMDMEQRSRDNMKFSQFQANEDEFHLQQARLRSQIRIQDGRAKPIDLLAKYISADEEVDTIEMHEPYTYLNGLTVTDLEDLLEDIKVYDELDLKRNKSFWDDIVVIVEDELSKLHKAESQARADAEAERSQYEEAAERRQGINKAVAQDVQSVFEGKSAAQLSQLQTNIESKLQSRAEGVDVSYWESLLSQLKAHLARARLRDGHRAHLESKLQVLRQQQQLEVQSSASGGEEDEQEDRRRSPVAGGSRAKSATASADDHSEDDDSASQTGSQTSAVPQSTDMGATSCIEAYELGGYSPRYLTQDDLELGTFVVMESEDKAKREIDQSKSLRGSKVDNALSAEEKALEREAKKGMNNEEEASFAVESALEQTYEWSDKYRPRKPRYFNRVHTGFEWNKYNQTHYDVDNPPPKVVQGYKFNIFYPDLISKSSTPEYTLTPCADNKDFCIMRIHAGPPYEDIAFKIVNREWEFGYKRGFKCQFQNNIFQLWFHFKRLRYRR